MQIAQDQRAQMAHMLNRGAGETLSAQRVIVEELLPVENITVRIQSAARPQAVTSVIVVEE